MNRSPITRASDRRIPPLWKAGAKNTASDAVPSDSRARLLMGLVFTAVGLAIVGVGTGWLPINDAGMHAPRWVIAAVGAVFALAGLAVAGAGHWPTSFNALIGAIICTVFACVAAWIAFGDGPRRFSGTASGLMTWFTWRPENVGRWAFGIGAAVMTLVSIIAWLAWLRALNVFGQLLAVTCACLGAYLIVEVLPAEPKLDGLDDDHARIAHYLALEPEAIRKSTRNNRRWNTLPWQNTEAWIKAARSRLAMNRSAPAGAAVLSVPRATAAPVIDGVEAPGEWDSALWIKMGSGPDDASVGLLAHGDRLYLAARAPADTTSTGYDQFRFWFHLDLSPHLANERVFVRGSGTATSLRSVRDGIRTDADAPSRRTARRAPRRTQWHIYERTQAASRVEGFRRYELSLDMAEAGIVPGAVLPVFFAIEGDPLLNEHGKFRARRILGRAGTQRQPLWLRVEK